MKSSAGPVEPDGSYEVERIIDIRASKARGNEYLIKWRFYEADAEMLAMAMSAPTGEGVVRRKGRIATGSIFVTVEAKKAMKEKIWDPLGNPEAVEMENAGVGCAEC